MKIEINCRVPIKWMVNHLCLTVPNFNCRLGYNQYPQGEYSHFNTYVDIML